jgi:hypothetical protein
MAFQTFQMGLFDWNSPGDPYSYEQLSQNWQKINFHDHTPGRGVQLSSNSFQDHSITGIKIALGSIEPDNLDVSGQGNPWTFQNVVVNSGLTVGGAATIEALSVTNGLSVGGNSVFNGSIQIVGTQPYRGFGLFDTGVNWDSEGYYTTTVQGAGGGHAGVLSLQQYAGVNYVGTDWGNNGAPSPNLVAMQWENDPNIIANSTSPANVTFPNNVVVGSGSFPEPGATGYLSTNQFTVTGSAEINYLKVSNQAVINYLTGGGIHVTGNIQSDAEGIFTGGVQSGAPGAPHEVISYGGITSIGYGLDIQSSGGISIDSGNIDVSLGSIVLSNGNLTVAGEAVLESETAIGGQLSVGSGQFGNNWATRPAAGGVVSTVTTFIAGDLVIGGALVFATAYTGSQLLQLAPGKGLDGHTALVTNAEYVLSVSATEYAGGEEVYTSVAFP